jgi:hypothetical protein
MKERKEPFSSLYNFLLFEKVANVRLFEALVLFGYRLSDDAAKTTAAIPVEWLRQRA